MSCAFVIYIYCYYFISITVLSTVAVPESAVEKIERMAVKEREIVHRNTRFTVDPFNQEKSKETITQAASFQAMMMQGKIGADGKEILPTQSPHVAGYGFVATPSPAPGMIHTHVTVFTVLVIYSTPPLPARAVSHHVGLFTIWYCCLSIGIVVYQLVLLFTTWYCCLPIGIFVYHLVLLFTIW